MKRRWLLAVPGLFALVACQIIAGLTEPQGVAPPSGDDDAGTSDAAVDPCKHARPPPPPAKDDDINTKNDYWFAATRVELPLKQAAGAPPRGYDIDNACTCAADLHDGGPSCNANGATVCDLDGGIDDGFAGAFGGVIASFKQADIAEPANSDLAQGARTLLLYVGQYNGRANDGDVLVQFVSSGGLYDRKGCSEADEPHAITYGHQPGDPHTPDNVDRLAPNNDGCDRWSPEVGKLDDSERKPSALIHGYVTGHQLVVSVDEVAASIFGSRARLRASLTVATIATEGDHLRMDGIIGARMPSEDLLRVLGGNQVGDGFSDGGYDAVCEQDIWPLAKTKVCAARDIRATPAEDFKNAGCDAISLNIGFSMVQARISTFDYTNRLAKKDCPDVICP